MNEPGKLTICLLAILFTTTFSAAQKPELVVQTGHTGGVISVAFSPDGKVVASGASDQTIKLWEVASGTELRTLTGHSDSIRSVAFNPDGTILASGSWDKTIKLWDVRSGTELRALKGHSRGIESVAFSPDGKILASASEDGTIKLWDVSSGTERRTLTGHSDSVTSVAFSPDGAMLASGSLDKTIKLWDVISGTERRTLTGHSDSVTSVVFSPDGKKLASGSWDKTARIWGIASSTELRIVTGHSGWVRSVAFSPNGRMLASASDDKTIRLHDVINGAELGTLKHSDSDHDLVYSAAFSPDGKMLASSSDKTIKLWDVTSGTDLRTFTGHSNWVRAVAFSADGKSLASAGGDQTIKLWDLTSGTQLHTLSGLSEWIRSIAFSDDGRMLASVSGGEQTIKLWDVTGGNESHSFIGRSDPINSVAFSRDGQTLAIAGWDQKIRVWDVNSGSEKLMISAPATALAFRPDGKMLASGNNDDAINLWDVTSGKELGSLRGHSDSITSLAFSPDGTMLASGAGDQTIKLWNVTSGAELHTLTGHSDRVLAVAFSPDGTILASGSWDKSIRLWDVTRGTELSALKGHANLVDSLAFSPDGKILASGSFDGSLKLWRVADGTELATLLVLDEHDWAVVTSDGLFDGSAAAWNKIIWRFNHDTLNYAPVEAFFSDFYHPGLLADIFAGKRPKAQSDISRKDRRQPRVKLTLSVSDSAPPDAKLVTQVVTVEVDVAQAPAGARDLRLFRQGSLVKVWRGDVLKGKSAVTLEATIPIVAGENRLTAYAFNRDNIKSSDATLVVQGADSLKSPGTAYIIAVGINVYSNRDYNLKYAVADAQDVSAEVKRRLEAQGRYAQVKVISLSDAEATKTNVMLELRQLATRVQPQDTVIVYFAGHGTAHGNEFYLIPHDLGYDGPRTKLNEKYLQTILAHSISDRELEQVFEGIDAGQLLLVIDACNSGQALEAEEKRRGPMNSKGLAQLAYEKGMYVMTAAQSYQAAQEAAKFGHGFLTYALVEEGLKQGTADREPKDGTINLREWLNYATDEVPKMQDENILDALRGRGRYLNFAGDGSGPKDPKSNVQRPRIFYRRELESNPLVIAVLGAAHSQ